MNPLPTTQTAYKRRNSLAQQVVANLSERIRNGLYKPGEKLPTEPEVMAEFGVSRTVVREALSHLQAAGLVETRHGVGTFALAPPLANLVLDSGTALAIRDVLAMLELRISFETEAAALAATRRTQQHLQNMRGALDQFEDALTRGESAIDADFEFHLAIARATGNRYFEDVMTYLGTTTIPRTRLDTQNFSEKSDGSYLNRTNHEHEQVYAAITCGDVEGARAAMRTHLHNSMERLRQASAKA